MVEHKLKLFLSQEEIHKINVDLANRISRDYPPGTELTVIITLKGALLFGADLVRLLKFPITIDFVRLASYGAGTKTTGMVRILKDIEISPEGKDLLLLDEIVDSGRSLAFLVDRLSNSGAKSIRLCTLLDKKSRREVPVKVDYIGREVEDKFLVGYGLDFNEQYRQLKDIYSVE